MTGISFHNRLSLSNYILIRILFAFFAPNIPNPNLDLYDRLW